MTNNTTRQCVLFKGLSKKIITPRFDQQHSSSDGGAILLKACDEKLKLSETMASCLEDDRQQSKVKHSAQEMFRQRMFSIACGYSDTNDAARLASDPIFKLLSDRDPIDGDDLASQPSLSRFENRVNRRALFRMSESLAETVIQRHKRRKKKVNLITIDFDPTEDKTHGTQQLSLFNGFYDSRCYLPQAGFLTFDDEVEQYLFCYVLRPGDAPANQGFMGILKRLLPRLRQAFPRAQIRIRLDSGFSGPEQYEFFEAEGLEYAVCIGTNPVLKRLVEPTMKLVRQDYEKDPDSLPRYKKCQYAADSWNRKRWLIIKAAITQHPGRESKENPRFIITNIKGPPKHIYEHIYCARGDIENRIKELKDGLEIDRTSCSSFKANQFRVLMTAAAYVLMQELRLHARRTSCARAQVNTLRLRLLKLGVWIESSLRRIVLHLPMSTPYADEWRRIARSLGAVPT
ncbi:MAG: IS1380 family transposase [Proteobacteria bacterium]|nr:IS1380 family transposase [Pseudomonadota bacterium]